MKLVIRISYCDFQFRTIKIFVFIIGFFHSSLAYCLNEREYIDSLKNILDSWNDQKNITEREKLFRLDSLHNNVFNLFGDTSVVTAYLIHKKGVIFYNLSFEEGIEYLDSAIYYYNKALDIRKLSIKSDGLELTSDIINGYNMIGICYSLKGEQTNSITNLLEGLKIADQYPLKDSIFNRILKLYTQTARTYTNIGDYDQALKYYNGIIDYPIENRNETDKYTISDWKIRALLEMSALYSSQLYNPAEAIHSLEKAESIIKNNPALDFNYFLPGIYTKKGIAYLRKLEFKKSKTFFEKAIRLNKLENDYFSLADNLMNIGIVLNRLDLLDSSENFLEGAKALFIDTYRLNRLAFIYDNLGDLEYNKGNYHESLEYDNLSMTYMIGGFNPESNFENPSLGSKIISDKVGVLISLSSKAETFLQLNKMEGEIKYLDAAFTTYQLADQVIGMMRSEFQAEASRMSLASYSKPIYEQGIESCYQLYQLNHQDSILEKAFEFSEKSRAIVLLDAIRRTRANEKVRLELISQERELNLKVNYFEKQDALKRQSDKEFTDYVVSDSITYYRRRHHSIIDSIRKETPDYYNLIFNQATTSMAQIRNTLKVDQSFIEFFVGDSTLFTFYIDQDTSFFLKTENVDSVHAWTATLGKSMENQDLTYLQPSNMLYLELLAPISDFIKSSEKLVIVPDAMLNQINFETLLVKLPESDRINLPDIKNYMIYDHQICYSFSASTLFESKDNLTNRSYKYLGVAPQLNSEFYIDNTRFDRLDHNAQEVEQSGGLFSDSQFLISKTTKESFIDQAPEFNIIHCATHALANNEDGDLSYLLFGDTKSEMLYAKDLYALDLNADLVLMSACQTNVGEILRGEGVIGLARAFTYAGASSVVTSLWDVREKANTKIIQYFYKELINGRSKDEALRNAKLNFINSLTREQEALAHPYYWAPMIIIGDTYNYYTKESLLKWVVLTLVVLAAIYLWYIKKR